MKPESDFSFSEPPVETAPSAEPSLHIPFALLTCVVAVFMIAQTVGIFKQRSDLLKGKAQLTEESKKRESVVKQADAIQTGFSDLFMDLLILSKSDDDAKQIISKYGIQQNGQASPAPAETPAK